MIGPRVTSSNLLKGYGAATPRTYGIICSVAPNPMTYNLPPTYIQQHPNAPYFGETVSFTPMGDHVLVVADSQMLTMTRDDARIEWRQNAAQGWIRLR